MNAQDLKKALETTKPSVCQDDLERYKKFNKDYGTFQVNKDEEL